MGAAGLTSSGVEMAGRSGCGVVIDLNLIPARTARLKPFEYLLSESQERMLCAVTPDKAQEVIELCKKHQVAAAVIGSVNDTGEFICTHNDTVVCALPVEILTENAPKYSWPLQDRNEYLKEHSKIERPLPTTEGLALGLSESTRKALAQVLESDKTTLAQAWPTFAAEMPSLMAHPTHASKDPLTRHYCSTVQGNTISGCQTPRSCAASVVRLDEAFVPTSERDPFAQKAPALAMVAGCQERWIELDPLHGSAQSTLLLARAIAASGGRPLGMTDCLNFGSPKQPAVMRQISDAIDGINSIAKNMHIPIVSGNVSLNNQTGTTPIPPTPMVGIVGVIDDLGDIVENLPPASSRQLYWLCSDKVESLTSFSLSEMSWNVFLRNSGGVPEADFQSEKNLWSFLRELKTNGSLSSCAVVGCGGLVMTLMTLAARAQSAIKLTRESEALSAQTACAEGQAGVLISGPGLNESRWINAARNMGLRLMPVAELIDSGTLPAKDAELWQSSSASFKNSLKPFFG